MRTIDDCHRALDLLSDNLARANGDLRKATALDRSLSCRITDLDVTFVGRLAQSRIADVTAVPGPPPERAQIRLTMKSDDLIDLVNGELNFAKAWGSGRVKLEASLMDLLRLRTLL
ncbi:SCP2 sterol-binding domain-containing protein [Streptomyces pathocidini]|uniref:SCP2 sterol-binding domain-containing protein n=1 Tax=Streptomyces pathocidini TaxID=1650571 RepID=A0ABW7UXH6_9ACTN